MGKFKAVVIIAVGITISLLISILYFKIIKYGWYYILNSPLYDLAEPLILKLFPFVSDRAWLIENAVSDTTDRNATLSVVITCAINFAFILKLLWAFRYVSICSSCSYSSWTQIRGHCPECGSLMVAKCGSCGKPFDVNVEHCVYCGNKVRVTANIKGSD